ncbi:MAG: ATP-binding protein [Candidatus Thiodiazotropha sp. (ex Lucina aurantia)]|nr:ATP-binding protein [Candidatus Thiodiazotropha taylori]MBV2099653.1 ATP-binding protein [Candidatus Thiodiazotropha sp. (ex Codakia orbicularis)]MBV2102809.1 ATP-binding protein [Candidatus Thiodiazotropha sp. (ex Lucina aurantia)]MBV2117379.1 ATP-binding protein [Candidatus Thiodiazotropha sp. (ex Lucina aurantia)]
MARPKRLPFTVDGQLIGELGQRLVTRNHVALAELIKNSYDADATSVNVSFKSLSNPDGVPCAGVEIVDNGLGMSMDVIEKNWMRIATANKRNNSISSKYGRPRTGSKGIGRFSCERLAKYLHLITTAGFDGELQTIDAWFLWDDFKPGTNLADIPIAFSRRSAKTVSCGTTLRLVDLRDEWKQGQFDTLARAVMSLTVTSAIRRKNYEPDPGFSLELKADKFISPQPDLFERLVDAGWGRMAGYVSDNGKITIELKGKYLDKQQKTALQKQYPHLAGLEFDIGFLRGGTEGGYELNRDTKTLTKKLLEEFREQAGVRVYFEGFRVYPYGEPGDDWLSLDKDYARRASSIEDPASQALAESMKLSPREVGLVRPRNANLLGRVHLNQKSATHITTKMSREGFTDSIALKDLITILRTAIEWATVHYAFAREQHWKRKRHEAEQMFVQALEIPSDTKDKKKKEKPLVTAIDFLAKAASTALPVDDSTPQSQTEKIVLAQSVIATNLDEKEQEISRLRTLASTAPLLFTFTHEVYSLISQLDTHANTIKQIAKKQDTKKDTESLESAAKDLRATGENFRAVASLFGVLTTTKDSEQKRHYVLPLLEGLVQGTNFALRESAIDVRLLCDKDIKTPRMRKAEFVSIAVNLYVNSLKSTMAAKGKRIEIRCFNEGNEFVLQLVDQGVGLAKKYRDSVFDPFISDPEHKIYSRLAPGGKLSGLSSLGQGSGLGLSIVKGITNSKGGNIAFFNEKGWKIGIRIAIPRG